MLSSRFYNNFLSIAHTRDLSCVYLLFLISIPNYSSALKTQKHVCWQVPRIGATPTTLPCLIPSNYWVHSWYPVLNWPAFHVDNYYVTLGLAGLMKLMVLLFSNRIKFRKIASSGSIFTTRSRINRQHIQYPIISVTVRILFYWTQSFTFPLILIF